MQLSYVMNLLPAHLGKNIHCMNDKKQDRNLQGPIVDNICHSDTNLVQLSVIPDIL